MTTAAGWTTNQTPAINGNEKGPGRKFGAFRFLDSPFAPGYGGSMEVTVQIPDDIANRVTASGVDLSRRTLENFALEEFRAERITKVELRKMLGLERIELDGFLNSHGLPYDGYTLKEVNRQLEALRQLGI